jgi:hypothetical protein
MPRFTNSNDKTNCSIRMRAIKVYHGALLPITAFVYRAIASIQDERKK